MSEMNAERFADMSAILHLGRTGQNKLADVNKVVTDRIQGEDYSKVNQLFEELLAIAGETDIKKMAQKEERLDGLSSDLAGQRIELLKELELLQAMRCTNDVYNEQLRRDIDEGEAFLHLPVQAGQTDIYTRQDAMQKRVQELMLTYNVGISFSEQIKLAEANITSLSDRIWNVLMNLIPLLRGRLSVEHSRIMVTEIRKVMGEEA